MRTRNRQRVLGLQRIVHQTGALLHDSSPLWRVGMCCNFPNPARIARQAKGFPLATCACLQPDPRQRPRRSASRRVTIVRPHNGTRCSCFAFIRVTGIVHTIVPRSISMLFVCCGGIDLAPPLPTRVPIALGLQRQSPMINVHFDGYCQVDEKLVDRPPTCWAPARREPAILGIKNGRQLQLDSAFGGPISLTSSRCPRLPGSFPPCSGQAGGATGVGRPAPGPRET